MHCYNTSGDFRSAVFFSSHPLQIVTKQVVNFVYELILTYQRFLKYWCLYFIHQNTVTRKSSVYLQCYLTCFTNIIIDAPLFCCNVEARFTVFFYLFLYTDTSALSFLHNFIKCSFILFHTILYLIFNVF